MFNLIKDSFNKKVQQCYEENGVFEGWYDDNLKKCGPLWMKDELYPFMSKDREVIVLSPSANKGVFEYNAYKTFEKEGFPCKFILADLCGKTLFKDSKGTANFIFIKENMDAKEIKLSEKADIIIDIKGAVWYALKGKPKISRYKRLIKILKNYVENMRDDNSLLMIDAYEINNHSYKFRNLIKYELLKGKGKKDNKKHEEQSTYFYLKKIFRKKRVKNVFVESESKNPMIHTAHIRKDELQKIIVMLESKCIQF